MITISNRAVAALLPLTSLIALATAQPALAQSKPSTALGKAVAQTPKANSESAPPVALDANASVAETTPVPAQGCPSIPIDFSTSSIFF